MTKTYTLIAYRRDGYDDCSRTSSFSTIEVLCFSDSKDLVEKAGRLAFENEAARRKDHALKAYEFAILIDGLDRDASWDLEHAEEFDEIQEAIEAEKERLVEVERQQERDAACRRRLEEATVAEQAARDVEAREQELLQELIARHGVPMMEGNADAR